MNQIAPRQQWSVSGYEILIKRGVHRRFAVKALLGHLGFLHFDSLSRIHRANCAPLTLGRKLEFHAPLMERKTAKGGGRPPKHPVERLRGLLTTRVLMAKLGVTSVNGLTRALFPEYASKSPEMEKIERTWRRYVNGAVVPSTQFLDTVSGKRAAAIAPDCLRCLQSLAWDVLKGESVEEWALWKALNDLPSDVRSILFDPDDRFSNTGPRLLEFDDHVANGVAALAGFGAIETFVLLAAYARAISSEALRNAVAMTYMERRSTLCEDPELAEHFRELFTAVDKCMKIRMFQLSTMKLDVLMPWQGQMPEKIISDPQRPLSLLELIEMSERGNNG